MKYTKPMAELEKFALVDVVTTSTTGPSGDGTIETEEEEV